MAARRIKFVLDLLDILIPIQRLDLSIVYTSFNAFQDQIRDAQDIHKIYLGIEECLVFFPPKHLDSVRPFLNRLLIRTPRDEQVVALAEIFTILTVFVRGPIPEKGRFLFSLYNLSKTDLLSEAEHALMIFNMSNTLQKLGILGKLSYTIHDAKHAAFLAKFDEENQVFYAGLSQERLIIWLSTSTLGFAAIRFNSVFGRLIKVFCNLDGKADSLLKVLTEMQDHRKHDFPVPAVDFSKCVVHKGAVFVVYRGRNIVSLCLSPIGLEKGYIYVQCNLHVKFSEKSERYYKLVSYRRLEFSGWKGHEGH